MISLSESQSKFVAGTILGFVVLLIYGVAVHPLIGQYVLYDEAIGDLAYQLHRYEILAARQRDAEKELRRVERLSPSADYYLMGNTEALANANLQKYLKRVVESQGGELISTQTLEARESSIQTSVGLRIHMKCDIQGLLQILYTLETGKPMLFLENLVVMANPVTQMKTRRGAGNPGWLDTRFDLIGYMQDEGHDESTS